VNRWLDHLGAQNLNQINKNEFIDDLSNLKGFAKIIQSGIIGKANSVMDKLALLDLKLKEQKLLTQEIDGIRQHPGNINSNLGNNLPWKERLEEIVDNSASVHSEFDVALYGMCEVIKRINFYVKNMQKAYVATNTIRQSVPETKYYPHDQIVHENNVAYHNLGPKVGLYNEKDPLHNGDVHLPGSKVREDVHSPKSGLYNHKEKKHPHHKWVRRADHHLSKQIKKHIFPEIKKNLSNHVKNTVKHNTNISSNNTASIKLHKTQYTQYNPINTQNKKQYPGHLFGIPHNHHKKEETKLQHANPEIQQANKYVIDTIRASKAAENAAKKTIKLLHNVKVEASKRPNNPIIIEALKISQRNSQVAINSANKALQAVKEAKRQVSAVSQGKINPSIAFQHLKELKQIAIKSQKNAELAPKMSQAINNKVTQTVNQIKQQPHLNKQEINTAVKLIKKVVNSALKAENAAQEARKLAKRAQEISVKNPNNQIIRQAAKIALQNARISQKQAGLAADAVRKTKDEAKLFKSGREGVSQVFQELNKLSLKAQKAMKKAEAAPKKIVKLASKIPLQNL
jgi:hypothetical protein